MNLIYAVFSDSVDDVNYNEIALINAHPSC